jgi:outer membrane protein with glycine zipper
MQASSVVPRAILIPAMVLMAQRGSPVQEPVASPASLGMFVYPAKNQPPAQQQAEETECYHWARQQTGIDPLAPAPPPQGQQSAGGPSGAGLKGAAAGAAAGTAIGAIAGNTGEGAAIGAVAGGLRGRRMAKKEKKEEQQQAQQQAQAQTQQTKATFNKAYGACLEGKGYSVK